MKKMKKILSSVSAAALVFGSMSSYVAVAAETSVGTYDELKAAVAAENAEIKLTAPITISEDLDLNGAVITLDNTSGSFNSSCKAIEVTGGATVSNATLNGNGVNCYLIGTTGAEEVTLDNWIVRGGIAGINNGDPPTAVGASMIKIDAPTVLNACDAYSSGDNVVVKCDSGSGVTITGETKLEGNTALNVWVDVTVKGGSTVKSNKRIIVGKAVTLGNLTIEDATFDGGVMLYDSDTSDDIKGSVTVTEAATLKNFQANGYDANTEVPLDIDPNATVQLSETVTDNAANFPELLNALKGNENVTKSDGTPILVGNDGTVATAYAITIINDNALNGKATVSPEKAAEGTTVTVTLDTGAAEELDLNSVQIQYNGTTGGTDKVNDTTYTFTMPGYDVEVYAMRKQYTVACDFDADKGNVEASHTLVSKGDEVELTVSPKEGYALDTLTVKDADGNEIATTKNADGEYTFTMPAKAVNISATFRAKAVVDKEYEIILSVPDKNGIITVTRTDSKEGTKQTITVTPNEGYELDTLTVKDADGKDIAVTKNADGTYSFTMPAGDVIVAAEFKKTASTGDDDNNKPDDDNNKPDDDNNKPDDDNNKPGDTDNTNNGDNSGNNDNKNTGIALAVAPVILAGAATIVLVKKNKKK